MSEAAPSLDLDLALVDEIERAGILGWPPAVVEELADGWILRATPGLASGRSSHALVPRTRALAPGELTVALARVRAFSALHGIRGGLQVSPVEVHADVVPRLAAAGWEPTGPVSVLVADREAALALGRGPDGGGDGLEWVAQYGPDPAWLDAWATASPGLSREVIDAHAATVFPRMGSRALFGRLGREATGVVVEDPDRRWAGLFALVVREDQRGRGLGRRLVAGLLEAVTAPRVYLQVMADNAPALALYERFGFRRSHGYQHVMAPEGWASAGEGTAGP